MRRRRRGAVFWRGSKVSYACCRLAVSQPWVRKGARVWQRQHEAVCRDESLAALCSRRRCGCLSADGNKQEAGSDQQCRSGTKETQVSLRRRGDTPLSYRSTPFILIFLFPLNTFRFFLVAIDLKVLIIFLVCFNFFFLCFSFLECKVTMTPELRKKRVVCVCVFVLPFQFS